MTSKKIMSCVLAASMLTGTLPVGMTASALPDTPTTVTITPGTDDAKTGTGSLTITLKVKQDINPTVSIDNWQYKGTPSTPVVSDNLGGGAETFFYKVMGADDSTYSPNKPTAQGSYTVKAVIAETDEYKSGTATKDFEILPYTTGLAITLEVPKTFEEPTYEWKTDGNVWKCTATRVCNNSTDADADETETVTATISSTTPGICLNKGKTTYAATFKNTAFREQTKTVADIDPLGHDWGTPIYTWRQEDGVWKCTAKRVCKRENHVQLETVTADSVVITPATCTTKGKTKYTATFNNEAFTKQTKTFTDIDALDHDWDTPSYNWTEENGVLKCTAERICKRDKSHKETETVTAADPKITPATCTAKGVKTYSVSFENKTFEKQIKTVEIPMLEHSAGTPVEENYVAPTYTTDGGYDLVTYCTECNEELSRKHVVLDKLTLTHVDAVEATYSANGNIEYWYDEANGKYFTDGEGKNEISYDETVIPMVTNDFSASWKWATDYSSATLTLTEKTTGKKVYPKVTITSVTEDPTCTKAGKITYTAKATYNNVDYTYSKEVTIPATGHAYSAPKWTWTANNSATATFICADCGDKRTVNAAVKKTTVAPTYAKDGKDTYTATVTFGGKTYTNVQDVIIPKLTYTAPTITYKKGENAVKLTWTAVDDAEKYAVCGYVNGEWKLIGKTTETEFVVEDLTAGKNYKMAVIPMFGGEWFKDYSNAITVTPKSAAAPAYPTVTSIDYNEQYHQFRLTWDAVDGAEKYGVVVYLAGKWKVFTQDIPANTTSFTSPKLKAGQTYKMAVCAKINGVWDTNKIESRAFEVTVK